jgi:hypothetical protein
MLNLSPSPLYSSEVKGKGNTDREMKFKIGGEKLVE